MNRPWLKFFTEALQYPKKERLNLAVSIEDIEIVNVLESSIYTEDAIFFFENWFFEIGIYGSTFHTFMPFGHKNNKNYLTHGQDIDEKFLRKLFTGIEFVLYKLCHLIKHKLNHRYNFETETTSQRVKYFSTLLNGTMDENFGALFDEIWFVRNSFAHSFIAIENIKYNGVPLNICFGDSYVGRQYLDVVDYNGKIFMDDVHTFLHPLVTLFVTHQLEQLDKNKFFRLCDRLLKSKSLTR